jgi:hypothetical protein
MDVPTIALYAPSNLSASFISFPVTPGRILVFPLGTVGVLGVACEGDGGIGV